MPSPRIVLPTLISLCCLAGSASHLLAMEPAVIKKVEPEGREFSKPFPPSQIRPTLLDFITGVPISYKMQVASTPKLMRPPFANEPTDTAKGLAFKIKAEQLDVKNRVKAVRFLGQQDCMDGDILPVAGEPPKPGKAQMVLIKTMQSDPSEVVRYEAVLALQEQLGRGPCAKAKVKRNARGRYENCLGCCNETVLNALTQRAYDLNAHACPLEPSERVRQACIEALAICCIDCNAGPVADPVMNQPGIEVPPLEPTPVPAQPLEEPINNGEKVQ